MCIRDRRKITVNRLTASSWYCDRCNREKIYALKHDLEIDEYIYKFSDDNNMDPGKQPIWAQGKYIY